MANFNAIKIQNSAVLKLKNVQFFPDPNEVDEQQQPVQGGSCVYAIDGATVYLQGDFVIETNADNWIELDKNSNVSYINNCKFVIGQELTTLNFSPFKLSNNSSLSLEGDDFVSIDLENTNYSTEELFSNSNIDTTSSLKLPSDWAFDILKNKQHIKGSLNNVFYGLQVYEVNGTPNELLVNGSLVIDKSQGNEQLCMRVNNEWLCIPFRTTT